MGLNLSEHEFFSKNREGVKLSGVSDVESFDDRSVIMQTTLGRLAIEGDGLHISVLNIQSGEVEVQGRVNGVFYIDEGMLKKRGLFSKGK